MQEARGKKQEVRKKIVKGVYVVEKLTDLPGIGPKMEEALAQVGINTVEQLRQCGSRQVFINLHARDNTACLHKLYALEAAVQGIPKKMLDDNTKTELKELFHTLKNAG